MFSLQQTVHFSPEAKYVPTDFKDKDLIVRKLGKDGRIHFALKGSPLKAKLSSTTADRIVAGPIVSNPPRFEGGSQAGVDDFAGDPELGHKAARFGLKLNDFFATPPSAHCPGSACAGETRPCRRSVGAPPPPSPDRLL